MDMYQNGIDALVARRRRAVPDAPSGLQAALEVMGGMREGLVNPNRDNNLISRGLGAAGDFLYRNVSAPVMNAIQGDFDPVSGRSRARPLYAAAPTATIGLRG